MTTAARITQAITDFVRGGDDRDLPLLDKVLHQDFRINNNGYMGTPGVTIIDKAQYLANIKTGIFGGLPRKMSIESLDESGTIAMVKLRLESAANHFLSYNALVLDEGGEWRLINNLAIVEPKAP